MQCWSALLSALACFGDLFSVMGQFRAYCGFFVFVGGFHNVFGCFLVFFV